MEYLILSIIILFFGAIITLFTKGGTKQKICSVSVFLSSILAFISSIKAIISNPKSLDFAFYSSIFGQISLSIDALSAIFIIIIAIMGFLGVLYSNGYLKPYLNINNK